MPEQVTLTDISKVLLQIIPHWLFDPEFPPLQNLPRPIHSRLSPTLRNTSGHGQNVAVKNYRILLKRGNSVRCKITRWNYASQVKILENIHFTVPHFPRITSLSIRVRVMVTFKVSWSCDAKQSYKYLVMDDSDFLYSIRFRERTIWAHTDTIRYEYSSIHNGRYRYLYEYSVRWCPSHL